jgi:cell division protein FtsZ
MCSIPASARITDLVVKEGLINLDFADVRAVMREMGKALMGTGDKRALRSAEAAISNPLIDDVSLRGARGVLISITGGRDLTLYLPPSHAPAPPQARV